MVENNKTIKKLYINTSPKMLPLLPVRHFVFFQSQDITPEQIEISIPNFSECFIGLMCNFSKIYKFLPNGFKTVALEIVVKLQRGKKKKCNYLLF